MLKCRNTERESRIAVVWSAPVRARTSDAPVLFALTGALQTKYLPKLLCLSTASYAQIRYLAYFILSSLHYGSYVVAPDKRALAPDKIAAIERFARLYLANPKSGDAGFDEALTEVGLQTHTGQPLTIARIRRDLLDNQNQ